jgi:hypothetical protein
MFAGERQRLQSVLPDGYLGNTIFMATQLAEAGKVNGSLADGATMVQVELEKMDDEYCHLALDNLEVEHASRLLRICSRFLVVWLSDNRYAL